MTTQNTTPYTAELETVNDVKIQRMNAEHYKMLSFTVDRIYDIRYNKDIKRWECNCPDVRYNKNFLCKHVTLLRVWIRAAEAEARAETAEATALAEQTAHESTSRQIYNMSNRFANIIEEQSTLLQCALLQIELLKREQAKEQKAHVEVASAHDIIIAELRYEKFPALEKTIETEARHIDYIEAEQKDVNSYHASLISSLKEENQRQAETIAQQAAELKEIHTIITCMQQEREQASALIAASAELIKAMQQSQQAHAPQERKITISIDGDADVKKAAATSKAPAARKPTIEKISLPNGNNAYKVDKKYTVRTDRDGKFSMSCNCSKGANGKICEHGKAVDLLLGATVDEEM